MKLAALGAITGAIGIGLEIPGLIGIGLFWVLVGPLMRQHGKRLTTIVEASPQERPPVDGRTFAVGTLLWALLGVPSLLVGILEIGIGADDASWRWLPIAVGGLAAGLGGAGAVLYLVGGAIQGKSDKIGVLKVPANIWIRAVRETGAFINERPRMEFELQVEPDASTGLAAYPATKKATVPFTALGTLRVGDGFRALVAGPDNPTAMDILWDEPVAAPGGAGTADQGDVSARLEALERLRRDGSVNDEEYREQRERILGTL